MKEFDNCIQQTKEFMYKDVLSAPSSIEKKSSLAVELFTVTITKPTGSLVSLGDDTASPNQAIIT